RPLEPGRRKKDSPPRHEDTKAPTRVNGARRRKKKSAPDMISSLCLRALVSWWLAFFRPSPRLLFSFLRRAWQKSTVTPWSAATNACFQQSAVSARVLRGFRARSGVRVWRARDEGGGHAPLRARVRSRAVPCQLGIGQGERVRAPDRERAAHLRGVAAHEPRRVPACALGRVAGLGRSALEGAG